MSAELVVFLFRLGLHVWLIVWRLRSVRILSGQSNVLVEFLHVDKTYLGLYVLWCVSRFAARSIQDQSLCRLLVVILLAVRVKVLDGTVEVGVFEVEKFKAVNSLAGQSTQLLLAYKEVQRVVGLHFLNFFHQLVQRRLHSLADCWLFRGQSGHAWSC